MRKAQKRGCTSLVSLEATLVKHRDKKPVLESCYFIESGCVYRLIIDLNVVEVFEWRHIASLY